MEAHEAAPTPLTGEALESQFDALVDDLRKSTVDPRARERLQHVGAVCLIRVKDAPHLEVTLCLDRDPIEILDHAPSGRADLELEIDAAYIPRFWTLSPAMAVLRGEASYRGQVRRFFQMYPVMRRAAVGPGSPDETM